MNEAERDKKEIRSVSNGHMKEEEANGEENLIGKIASKSENHRGK